jgi:DNA-binding transcriptional LysR family regulator
MRDRLAGRLVVGGFPTVTSVLLPRAIARLTAAHPGLQVKLTEASTPAQVAHVEPVEVVVGENSPAFFHEGAQALVDLLPPTTLRVLPGQDHGAFWAAPDVLADMIVDAVTVARG